MHKAAPGLEVLLNSGALLRAHRRCEIDVKDSAPTGHLRFEISDFKEDPDRSHIVVQRADSSLFHTVSLSESNVLMRLECRLDLNDPPVSTGGIRKGLLIARRQVGWTWTIHWFPPVVCGTPAMISEI